MKPIYDDYSQPIDWKDELTACAELLEQSWNVSRLGFNEGHERVDQTPARRLVELVFEKAAHVGENGYVSQDLKRQFYLTAIARKQHLMSKGCSSSVDLLDGILVMLSRLCLADAGKKPLHDAVLMGLRERIDEEICGVDFIAPLNYGAFMANFRKPDDSHAVDQARELSQENADTLLKSFKGSESIALSSFPEDLSMHSVGFFDKQMGYAPCESLLAALISQSLSTKLVNNTVELCQELRAIVRADFVEGKYTPSSAGLKALVQNASPIRRVKDEYISMELKDYKPKGRKSETSFEP